MASVRPSHVHGTATSRAKSLRRCGTVLSSALLLLPAAVIAQKQQPAQQGQAATPVPSSTDQIAAQQHALQVQDLVNRAEQSYQSGVNNYNANHLDAARMDFDSAVDIMLASGMDLKNDPMLSDEFERLLDAINSLEMDALRQGNGFSPKMEAAPLEDALKDVTFPSNPALVKQVEVELKTTQSDLPLVINDYVAGFISYFSNSPAGHAHLKRSLERAGKYSTMISRVLRENGMPQDLIYLAVAESGFQPQVVNRSSGAGGMWQFMPFQGAYGLARNGYFDERFDPEKSTLAYARYMKYLYNQFGDWYLAMAAYNWGPGNVQHAVSRTGYADFWELYRLNHLPSATKAYVPGIIAAAIMAKNPKQYGLTDVVPDSPVLSDTVTTSYAIDLKLVADLTNSSVPEIVALNPALLRLSTPRDIPYDLHIPPGTHDVYIARLKDIPEDDRTSWRFHVVKQGETLEGIATDLHANPALVAQVNEVSATNPIQTGDELVIPLSGSRGTSGQQRYTAHRGDTLVTIADRFGVSVEQLRTWNGISANRIAPGRSLYVAEPVRLATEGRGVRGRHGRTAAGRASAKGRSSAHGVHAAGASTKAGAAKTQASSGASHTATHTSNKHKR